MNRKITPIKLEKNVSIKIGVDIIFNVFISRYNRETKMIFIKYSIPTLRYAELNECVAPSGV